MEVCSTLLSYDWDKKVPVWGFGAKPKFEKFHSDIVNHCFNLIGDPAIQEVYGVEGILKCYENAIRKVIFNGPTFFGPVR